MHRLAVPERAACSPCVYRAPVSMPTPLPRGVMLKKLTSGTQKLFEEGVAASVGKLEKRLEQKVLQGASAFSKAAAASSHASRGAIKRVERAASDVVHDGVGRVRKLSVVRKRSRVHHALQARDADSAAKETDAAAAQAAESEAKAAKVAQTETVEENVEAGREVKAKIERGSAAETEGAAKVQAEPQRESQAQEEVEAEGELKAGGGGGGGGGGR